MATPQGTARPTPRAGPATSSARRWSRRRFLGVGIGGVGAVAMAGLIGTELVDHRVLPGKSLLDRIDGACAVDGTRRLRFGSVGPSSSSQFYSRARRRTVGYTVAYPPGHGPGSALPLIVMLHGYGCDHRSAMSGMQPAGALALLDGSTPLAPMAMVTVDGGNGYWHAHRGDDPMAMVVDELVPMLQEVGLGRSPHRIATMGISMGGYGAILLAERHPALFGAVAAISPAVWTSYAEARGANASAYDSPAQFARYDAVTHTAALVDTPVRVASGDADPFRPGVVALAAALPRGAIVDIAPGCHTGAFFTSQVPPSMRFLSRTLGA